MTEIVAQGPLADKSSGGVVDGIIAKVMGLLDVVFPPAQRAKWWEKFKAFAVSHPKITVRLSMRPVDHVPSKSNNPHPPSSIPKR
jgi:hypothetical protein